MMTGLQASGKSTFARHPFGTTHKLARSKASGRAENSDFIRYFVFSSGI